ncbi:site-specific integrase [Aciditerrimonas ferrireducens]|uniref:Site-specific integrase n=1 Tax=Aciditerrimonas ferrireducens TaxID=667306 RepID=A0ABV6BZU6_9ACTN
MSGEGLVPASDPLALVDETRLDASEARYVAVARAANTLRGYRSDWAEWCAWCAEEGYEPLPASPEAISRYLVRLAGLGAKVGTMSRRLSALRFAHRLRDLPDPTEAARVLAVWEGIRREHSAPPQQAKPLMPPELWQVLDACPTMKHWRTPHRPPEPDLAGLRDRVLLLVGFVGALRRSELAAIEVGQLSEHPEGLVLHLPRSKTNQAGEETELVVLPRASDPAHCPVTLVDQWRSQAGISSGPLLRPVTKSNKAAARPLHPESINALVQAAVARAGLDPTPYSAHSLRAGFVTYAHLQGATDRAIAHQTRHRSLASVGTYIRVDTAWDDNAATQLGI